MYHGTFRGKRVCIKTTMPTAAKRTIEASKRIQSVPTHRRPRTPELLWWWMVADPQDVEQYLAAPCDVDGLMAFGLYGALLVFEWVDGQDLGDFFPSSPLEEGLGGCWSEERRLKLYHELKKQVAKLHEMGLTHGELHGGNIMVDRADGVWLLDFETCRPADEFSRDDNAIQEWCGKILSTP